MQYVLIENPGVAPAESFTILGASTKSDDNTETIGRFGSGNKHAVCVLLRHNIPPVIFSSNLKMNFGVKATQINDGMTSTEFGQVQVQYGGKDQYGKSRSNTEDLSFVMEYGRQDWGAVGLALREFVSNALDHAVKYNAYNHIVTKQPWDGATVRIVEENQVRAKQGFTRVFVPLTTETKAFVDELSNWFLHFADPKLIKQTVLAKNNRSKDNHPVIYRRGVLVREVEAPSLFDYNLESLRLDESRQASDWDVRYYAAKALRDADEHHLVLYLSSLGGENYWEYNFSASDLEDDYYESAEKKAERRDRWDSAFRTVYGDKSVLCSTDEHAERLRHKGYTPITVSSDVLSAMQRRGLRSYVDVLTEDEIVGRTLHEASQPLLDAVRNTWAVLEKHQQTNNKPMPNVVEFTYIASGPVVMGQYYNGTVYFNRDYVGSADSIDLKCTILEELGHYVTGSLDCTRDFQNYFIRLAAVCL